MFAAARGRSRIRLAFVLGVVSAVALATSASAEVRTVVPYASDGYSYKQVATNAEPGFEQPAFDASSFLGGGLAPFGSHTGLCASYASFRTAWAENTDMLVRRSVTLPPGTTQVTVGVAIDNRVQVFWNGTDVSNGLQEPGGCTFNDHSVFNVPDVSLLAGANLLAVRAQGGGDPNFLDMQVRADIETAPPDTTIASGPSGSTTDSTPTFSFSSSEPGSSFQCRIDATAFASCSSPHTTAALGAGSHTFEVIATDPAANSDPTPASRSFTVSAPPPRDTTPPETTVTAGPSGPTSDSTPTFSFSSSEPGSTFQCRIDGGPFVPCTSPFNTPRLSPGAHTFEVRAIDLAGNVDPSPASTFDMSAGRRTFVVQALEPPVLAKRVNVEPVKGDVFVSVPGGTARASATVPGLKGRRFVPLREAKQIPVGSLLDTRRGTARLTSASDSKGATQSGDFDAGVFQVLQSRERGAKGLTELRLKGASFASCGRTGRGKGASVSARRAIRRLRGNAKGRFRTRGRYSSATVRGTIWTVSDRCDGTLTQVKRGRVAVRDIRRKKTIVVKAGKSYLARPRR